jgi:type III secretion system FlhB-like substrate exporter
MNIDQELYKVFANIFTYIHTYHSRFIPEGVAEASQIFL